MDKGITFESLLDMPENSTTLSKPSGDHYIFLDLEKKNQKYITKIVFHAYGTCWRSAHGHCIIGVKVSRSHEISELVTDFAQFTIAFRVVFDGVIRSTGHERIGYAGRRTTTILFRERIVGRFSRPPDESASGLKDGGSLLPQHVHGLPYGEGWLSMRSGVGELCRAGAATCHHHQCGAAWAGLGRNRPNSSKMVRESPAFAQRGDLAGFRVGDILEMGFTLVAFRQASTNEDNKQIRKLVLRILMLLDDLFVKAVFKAHSKNEAKAPSIGSRLMQVIQSLVKKHFDFHELSSNDEDYPETRCRMAAMRDKMQWWNESKEDRVRVSIKNIFGDAECSANFSESKNPGMLANNLRTMPSLNILGRITALHTISILGRMYNPKMVAEPILSGTRKLESGESKRSQIVGSNTLVNSRGYSLLGQVSANLVGEKKPDVWSDFIGASHTVGRRSGLGNARSGNPPWTSVRSCFRLKPKIWGVVHDLVSDGVAVHETHTNRISISEDSTQLPQSNSRGGRSTYGYHLTSKSRLIQPSSTKSSPQGARGCPISYEDYKNLQEPYQSERYKQQASRGWPRFPHLGGEGLARALMGVSTFCDLLGESST
ncbi:hypothetical protein B0H17DRAFT_1145265 [Mycena rosella]|uniref:Uncharacterized protein n=1 Tax=Mycena rosella TaxID=1033263 RepID=A0AAD7G5T7_MYCRO|nr:hypothetical protein B0H17DRAFT_1145265 [Mycena rosella]